MSDILLVLGAAAVCAGLFIVALPVGLIGTGALLILAGVGLYRPKSPKTRE